MRKGRAWRPRCWCARARCGPARSSSAGAATAASACCATTRAARSKEALPGWPVEVGGLDELPQAGDQMYEVDDLKQAKDIAEEMRQQRREAELEGQRKPRTLEDLLKAGDTSQVPELNLIIKADVQGSVDVLKKALGELPRREGPVTHSARGGGRDHRGATCTWRGPRTRSSSASTWWPRIGRASWRKSSGVQIRAYRVIYEMLDDVHKALAGLLEPVQREEVRGAGRSAPDLQHHARGHRRRLPRNQWRGASQQPRARGSRRARGGREPWDSVAEARQGRRCARCGRGWNAA